MLSRRILRIKLLQALFAYEYCKSVNRWRAVDDLEASDVEDSNTRKKLSESQKKEIRQWLAKEPHGEDLKKIADPELKKASGKALTLYHRHNKKDLSMARKNLIEEARGIGYWYYSVLGLLLEWRQISKADQKMDHSPFFQGRFITALTKSKHLTTRLAQRSINWRNEKSQAAHWFNRLIKTDPVYIQYLALSTHDLESQDKMVKHIVRRRILKGAINEYFAEKDIRWFENQLIVKGMVEKTLKFFNAEGGKLRIPKLSPEWTADRLFVQDLFNKTTHIERDQKEMIARSVRNWEIERLPVMDRIVLELALNEMIHCADIPVKVTINEYIEIARRYSTDNSPQFVNGILDALANKLQREGGIKKSGRGLIDNK